MGSARQQGKLHREMQRRSRVEILSPVALPHLTEHSKGSGPLQTCSRYCKRFVWLRGGSARDDHSFACLHVGNLRSEKEF